MKLRIVTPLDIVVDQDVVSLRAADASGSFGILAGHADFLTRLDTTIIRWHSADTLQHYCAVRNGVLSVTGGDIAVATREAVPGDDLANLAQRVLARFRADAEAERSEHFDSVRRELSAIRQIVTHLRPAGAGRFP